MELGCRVLALELLVWAQLQFCWSNSSSWGEASCFCRSYNCRARDGQMHHGSMIGSSANEGL